MVKRMSWMVCFSEGWFWGWWVMRRAEYVDIAQDSKGKTGTTRAEVQQLPEELLNTSWRGEDSDPNT